MEKEDREKASNKRVRASARQAKVLVMAESEPSIESPKKEVMEVTIPMKVPIKKLENPLKKQLLQLLTVEDTLN